MRTLAHWASLTVYSSSFIPGEKPKLTQVKEQRITNILVHIAIGIFNASSCFNYILVLIIYAINKGCALNLNIF